MSAHVLLNELGKKIRCEAARLCRASYRFSQTSLINSVIQEHESIHHMTLKSHFTAIFAPKRLDFAFRKCDLFMDVNAQRYEVICISNTLVDYHF